MMKFFLILLLSSIQVWAQETTTTEPTTAVSTSVPVPTSIPTTETSVKNYSNRDINLTSKPIKVSFFSLASVKTADYDRGGASVGSYNYLGASYKLDRESQVAFRYVFYHDTAGYKFNPSKMKEENIGHTTTPGDSYFSYSRYDLGDWGGWSLAGQGRVYLPSSQYSRASGMVTQLRVETYLDHGIGKYSNFNYTVKYDYMVQSKAAHLDEDVPRYSDGTIPDRAVRGTKQMKLEHYFDLDWSLHKMLSFRPRVGFEETWYNSSKEENIDARHDTVVKTQVGFEFKPMRSLSFNLAMENQTSVANRKDPVAFGRPEENSWVLITYASF
jgi:hypothetical protein